jgi:hypothetical protein
LQLEFSPGPPTLRSILKRPSSSLSAARRISRLYRKRRQLRINSQTCVIDITPRSEKVQGVVNMPSPPPAHCKVQS